MEVKNKNPKESGQKSDAARGLLYTLVMQLLNIIHPIPKEMRNKCNHIFVYDISVRRQLGRKCTKCNKYQYAEVKIVPDYPRFSEIIEWKDSVFM